MTDLDWASVPADDERRWGGQHWTTSYIDDGLPAIRSEELVSRFGPAGHTVLIHLPVFSIDSFVLLCEHGAQGQYPDQLGRPRHRLAPALELALAKIKAGLESGAERRIRIRAATDYLGTHAPLGWLVVDSLGRQIRKEYAPIDQKRAA